MRDSTPYPFCCAAHATENTPKLRSSISTAPAGRRSMICSASPCSLTSSPPNIGPQQGRTANPLLDRKSTRLNSSHTVISYAVFCLKKKKNKKNNTHNKQK